MGASICFDDVSIGYPDRTSSRTSNQNPNLIFDGLNVSIEASSIVSVLGLSGSGKTSLLRSIAGILNPERGSIKIGDVDRLVARDRRQISYIPQNLALFEHLTVAGNIQLGRHINRRSNAAVHLEVGEIAAALGISDLLDKHPHQISGGERQRVSIARAIAVEPSLLLCDEPFASLDDVTRANCREQLKSIAKERGITTVFVTHHIEDAIDIGDRLLILGGTPASIVADMTSTTDSSDASAIYALSSEIRQILNAVATSETKQ